MVVLLSLVGGLYRSTLLERHEASSRDKVHWDYISPDLLEYIEISPDMVEYIGLSPYTPTE
jgi:hypothetical protein